MIDLIIILILSYIIGSLPTAIIAGKLLRKIDIREHGSGNAGATNVFRVLGWKAGLTVLFIDMLKGFVPVFWLAPLIHSAGETMIYYQFAAVVGAISGHVWTIFAGFKGGKGVGTSAGAFMGLAPVPVSIALLVFVIIVALTRYVSLGSLLAALAFLTVIAVQKYLLEYHISDIIFYLAAAVVALIWIAHQANIRRLLSGNENKISFSRSDKE